MKGNRSHDHDNGHEHSSSRGHLGDFGGGTGTVGAPSKEGVGQQHIKHVPGNMARGVGEGGG